MSKTSVYEKQLKKKPRKGIPRLLQIAGTKSVYLVIAAVFAVLAAVAQITPFVTVYLMVKELVSNIGTLDSIDIDFVWKLGWWTLGGIGLFVLFTFISGALSHLAAFNILFEIRMSLATKLARLPMGYFGQKTSGGIKKVLSEDVERIELFVAHHTLDITQGVVLPIITFIYLFFFDWRLAVATLVPIPLALTMQRFMQGRAGRDRFRQWQEKLTAMNGTIVEYVRGMPVVKIFNQSVDAFKRFSKDVYAFRDITLQWIKDSTWPYAAFVALLSSSAIFILPVAIYLLQSTPESGYVQMVTAIFLFLFIGMGIAVPLYKLMNMVSFLVQISSGLEQIDSILTEPEIPEPETGKTIQDHSIVFENVSFSYGQQEVLKNVSFDVKPGTITALVGPSGGGKTTISNLIGRFWDAPTGEIRIGGVNVKEMPIEELNNSVSIVFQDVFLFFDTIEENIRMGNQSATLDEVIEAAKAAQVDELIKSLPDGYQTLIGEGGTYLSGGEAQRISLARAILKDAPIVVLDEATAYADPENESKIQQALSHVLKDKTVVIIAHRLYTITAVDQILVVDRGEIKERGTHTDLLEKKGIYHGMWKIHTQARDWNMDIVEEVQS